jgi:hypothetical protein
MIVCVAFVNVGNDSKVERCRWSIVANNSTSTSKRQHTQAEPPNWQTLGTLHEMSVLLETSLGDIVIDLEIELCPVLCENFLKLCKVYYYNLNAFFNGIDMCHALSATTD